MTLDPTSAHGSVPGCFDAAALTYPDHDALRSPDSSLSYREARDLVHRVANAVLEAGVGRGDRVLLLFGHCPEAVAALIGASKAGAIAVPMSISAPADRRELIFKDAEPACLVTDSANISEARLLAAGRVRVLNIDELASSPDDRDWPTLDAEDAAFILYTSGSTGQPRGVVQTHRSVLRKIAATQSVLQITADDRIVMVSSYAVGQGFTAMFGTLFYGAALCILDVRRVGFERLVQWLVDERISIYLSSATLFRSLVRTLGSVRCPHLRFVRLGSERITTHEVDAFRRLFSRHARLLIAYSSTETSTIAMHVVDAGEQFPDGIVPVGVATDGLSFSIKDPDGRPLPNGVEGEIVVHSAALPLGYWRDAELTARLYRPSSNAPGVRRYNTGDLGRIRADGLLEHLGRRDRRVKVRGFRIELEEVETVLARHPAVAKVAVLAHADEHADTTLVAYLELGRGSAATTEEIRRFAGEHLPDFVVPTTFVVLDSLPVTDAGKVIMSRLPAPSRERPTLGRSYEAPRTDTEQIVADAWKEVLGLDAVGIHDPFLMVGGDSLRAAQVASRVSAATGIEVLLWELLDTSTISGLAALVDAKTAQGSFT